MTFGLCTYYDQGMKLPDKEKVQISRLLTDPLVIGSFTTPFEGGFGGYLGGRFLKLAVLVLTYCVLGGASSQTCVPEETN